jgi:hypothetical protein
MRIHGQAVERPRVGGCKRSIRGQPVNGGGKQSLEGNASIVAAWKLQRAASFEGTEASVGGRGRRQRTSALRLLEERDREGSCVLSGTSGDRRKVGRAGGSKPKTDGPLNRFGAQLLWCGLAQY